MNTIGFTRVWNIKNKISRKRPTKQKHRNKHIGTENRVVVAREN